MMKKKFSIVLLASMGIAPLWAQKTIQVQNPLDENRVDLISIPFSKFSQHFGVDTVFTIKDKTTGTIYLHQLEKLGTNTPQNVLVQVPIASKAKLKLVVMQEKPESYPSKAFARYVPERFDDFAWENDVVAFRMYGKALEGRADDAQGIDFWAKRTHSLVINNWYKTDDYHKDHGEGLDYYSVGQTLGAGDLALYFGNQVAYTKHYRQYEVLDNGPLRTTFKLTYEPQDFDGQTISLTKTITLDAGQQFNKVVVELQNQQAKTTPVVIALVKRNESNPQHDFDQEDRTLAYWEPNIQNNGHTGTALIVPKAKISFIPNDAKQFLLSTYIQNGKHFVYYNGATWDKAGKITSADAWEDYVKDKAEQLKKPLKVKLR